MKKKKQVIKLDRSQKQELESMLRKGRWSHRERVRAQILLEAHRQGENINKASVARRCECSGKKVWQVTKRFLKRHCLEDALWEKPRSGQPEKLNEKDKAFLIATACSKAPQGFNHWTLTLFQKTIKKARGKTVSFTPIRRVLLQNHLKPWKKKDVVYS